VTTSFVARTNKAIMEIHQLRYFAAVADKGSFSRAAARDHVAQPSLSQQIQKLEAEMGEKLFDRLPKSVVLTDAGNCLLDFARRRNPLRLESKAAAAFRRAAVDAFSN
jgi:DNA-binding transcriptional LysR family regulator